MPTAMTKKLVRLALISNSFWRMESVRHAVSLMQIAISVMIGTIVLLAKTKVSI